MVFERCSAIFFVALLMATAGTATATELEPPLRPEAFADDMIRAIGATPTDCAHEVVLQVEAHDMRAVCARFDGNFERFSLRWSLQILQETGDEETPEAWPQAQATTEWELTNEQIYDRIYRVGNTAVGVRFSLGDVLMIW